MTVVTPILDKEAIEKVIELRARLTRGGLAPEAIQKAIEAFQAGDIHALSFAAVGDFLTVTIPEELLMRVFPQVRDGYDLAARPEPGKQWIQFLERNPAPILEYEINRHRGDRRSLTIRWPGTEKDEGPESEAFDKEKVAASAAEPSEATRGADPF